MYKIDEDTWNEKYILLIPAMLDAHFPLIKYAFYSRDYHPVILSNEDHITDVGLKYVNNDMCYPIVLNAGQMIDALQSGKYDIIRTRLLMPTAGDACRGANYLHVRCVCSHSWCGEHCSDFSTEIYSCCSSIRQGQMR